MHCGEEATTPRLAVKREEDELQTSRQTVRQTVKQAEKPFLLRQQARTDAKINDSGVN